MVGTRASHSGNSWQRTRCACGCTGCMMHVRMWGGFRCAKHIKNNDFFLVQPNANTFAILYAIILRRAWKRLQLEKVQRQIGMECERDRTWDGQTMKFKQMTRNKYYDELEQADEQFDVRNKVVSIISWWIHSAGHVATDVGQSVYVCWLSLI